MNYYWKLNDEELKFVEEVYKKQETIFVDKDGILHTEDGGSFGVVKSEWYENVNIFIYEVENERIIQSLRKSNGARNSTS